MTRHRVPEAPARRQSRSLAPVQASAGSILADSIVADAIGAEYRTTGPDSTHADHDDGAAIVVQDGPTHRTPVPARARGRRQMVVTVLSACCVAALAAAVINVSSPTNGAVGVDNTGFGNLLAEPPSDNLPIPRTLLDPPVVGKAGTAADAAAGQANGLGDTLAQGVSALFGGAGSPWVQRLAAGAAIDPNSSGIVAGLASEKFQMSYKMWTVPVYYADKSTPRHDVPLTAGYQPEGTLRDVPVPANAQADPSDDAHLSIVDRSSGCVYDFWGASGTGSGLTAKMGNAIPTNSTGVYPGGLGSRGSGFSAAAGLVTADELRKGSIDHALVFAYPNTKAGGPVSPASKSDGQTSGSDALPEGGRVRLDPSLNLNSLGLNRYELIIARAMQQYGMILGDTSGGFTIYAQHPQSLPAGAYSGLLPDDTWVDLSKIPTDKLQVMKLPQQKSNESGSVGNRCNGF